MNTKFKKWLEQNGAEILPNTNEFEWIRFKGSETGVIYTSGKFSNDYAKKAFESYKQGKKWDGRPINIGRKKDYAKEKKALIIRDGKSCFYCGNLLEDDVTVEHLISLVSGGPNTLANMVLAHEDCNNLVGNRTVVEKVCYALRKRMEKLNSQLKDK
jgi:hypothetical protein